MGVGDGDLVEHKVVVVGDDELGGAAWAIMRAQGDCAGYLFLTEDALERDPEGCLSRAWAAWEGMRPRSPQRLTA